MNKLHSIDAIELISSSLPEFKRSLDSAEAFHKRAGSKGEGEEFFAAKSGHTPEDRARDCQHNRQVIDHLEKRLGELHEELRQSRQTGEPTRQTVREHIVQTLSEAIKGGMWSQGLFFRVIEKRLSQILARIEQDFEEVEVDDQQRTDTSGEVIKPEDIVTVFLSLYQAGGTKVRSWQTVLSNIAQHSTGRPIYKLRKDVEAFIRSRPQADNEAFVVVDIHSKDIIPQQPGKPLEDAEGRALITLHRGAIQASNIKEFVHSSGTYAVKYGRLELLDDDEGTSR